MQQVAAQVRAAVVGRGSTEVDTSVVPTAPGDAPGRPVAVAAACAWQRSSAGAGVPEAGCMARLGAVEGGRIRRTTYLLLRACAADLHVSTRVSRESRGVVIPRGWPDQQFCSRGVLGTGHILVVDVQPGAHGLDRDA